ncbi:MAG: TonB-dependent receptor [Pseudomonadota bacterium]
MKTSALTAPFLCLSITANAQELYQLNEVVVTATRTEKALIDVPVRTEVVNREQIERTHARDLYEALKSVPGLYLKRIHGKSGYSVWLQGLDADRVLVLIDGEPISASTGSTVDLTQISTAEIERIEIVKGASSALYGSSAMGGVVNVITRKSEKPVAWSVTVDGGSWGDDDRDDADAVAARHIGGNFSLQKDKWSVLLTGDVRDSDGYDLDSSTFATQGDEGSKTNLTARLSYRPDEQSEVFLSPRFYREDIQNRIATLAPGTPDGEIRRHKNELAVRNSLTVGGNRTLQDDSRISAYAMFETFEDDTEQDVIATTAVDQSREADIDTAKIELQWDKPVGDNQIVTSGIVYFDESLDQFQRRLDGAVVLETQEIQSDAERDNLEVYLQDDIFIGDRTEIVLGARAQDDSDFGSHVAPKVSLLYSPGWIGSAQTRVRAAVGSGYRVPNLKERFFIFDHSHLGYMVLGNPDLQPEESLSIQLGTEVIGPSYRFDINLFYNDIDDLIETDVAAVQNVPGVQLFEYVNIARARTQGLELSYGQQLNNQWRYNLAYTYLDAEDKDTGNTLPDRPEHQLKTELRYQHAPWDLDITLLGRHQSEEFIDVDNTIESPSWETWDIKINKLIDDGLSVFAGIDNIGNKHRTRFDGTDNRPDEGRFVYVGVRFFR